MVITALVSQILVAVPSIILGTTTMTSVVNGLFKVDAGWARHLISWIIAVVIGLGFVATGGLTFGLPVVWEYIAGGVAGLLAGGAANGFYDWKAISTIFDALEAVIRGTSKANKKEVAE